ncbi:DUF1611 domain-containing protein [Actomonas aquatica]|uniref:DUF1611 domain-containing protein n=1 Tax=Actomonas aquatica TaxID=2866162 RepID=A0ABZ1C3R2_9BACT|nr:DUF1611 domain-containing protein [Opitutus sp. WL0086]WRQ85923.1 DUF1611 domain-containing protein [Opitutus sp. WL0086]
MSDDFSSHATQPQRLVLLQHGGFSSRYGKTGLSLLRYRGAEVVAVIDREFSGRSLREVSRLPDVPDLTIVATMEEALATRPTVLAIGISPSGGRVQEDWWSDLRAAVRAGVSVWNGCHTPLAADPEVAAALRPGVRTWDLRREPADLKPGKAAARGLGCKRVLFVGTDMNIGKMTAALEFDRATRERGLRSAFVGTGQTGMMIAGTGVCLDAVRVDFASGAVEAEVMRHGADADVVWVEGQGSMFNPSSTATLPLLRGTQPTHLVVVAKAGLSSLQAFPDIVLPPLPTVVSFYETVAAAGGALTPAKVMGIALNTWGLDDAAAQAAVDAAAAETGLPCTDVVRFGPGAIFDAILSG